MLRNHIKIAFRTLSRNKGFTFINITGLAVGLAVCIMIMLYVTHEMSYDRFHKNGARIFNIHASVKLGGNTLNMAYMSYAAGSMIKQNNPMVEDYMRTLAYFRPTVVSNPTSPENKFAADKLLFADVGFFNFYSFKLLSGDASDVLKAPFSVVISRDMAKKYFGNANPVGQLLTIKTDSAYTYHITGVAENAPSNSSIDFNFVASTSSLLTMKEATMYTGAQGISFGSFAVNLLLKNVSDTGQLKRNLQAMAKKDKSFDEISYSLSPIADNHLKSNFGDSSNIKYLRIFPLVAVLILLLALVNYMSLSTARATLRAKEVGVRKVSGASRKSIAMQFYVESALFTGISFVLGYCLCYLCKPWFLNVLQLKIDNSFLYSPMVLGLMFALLVITVLIAGSYPSLVLSAFKPVITLKDKMSTQAGGATVRKVFTTLQFAISVGLIICGIIIDRQLYYFRHADTGLNRDNIVMLPAGANLAKNYQAFKKDISDLAGIANVVTSHHTMFKGYDMFWVAGKTKQEQSVGIINVIGDNNYIPVLGLKWKYPPAPNTSIIGRQKVVINELAVSKLHLPANPVGNYLDDGNKKYEIMGVLKNFNFTSMSDELKPLALFTMADTTNFWARQGCTLLAKIKPHTNLPSLLAKMQGIYKKYDQDTPFEYTFMDDAFNLQYKAEDRLAAIFSLFTYITVILATMGLFGLAAFTIEQRTKEIGIRKILGASLSSIGTLLSVDFLKLVLLSIIIASPIAWWAMHNWLQNFAYRIAIPWWVFTAAGIIAMLTAVITVSYHAIKAGLANPVDSLRSE
ncbi:ABC transporter permease [Mucilaginibacter ginsenosidivorax]|uniref:FtsX-like permease family protein n=1 Tax=Mucilaginibacter ginsenosidivorax TaxID=862126 RepID=A0A5B8W8Q0_9SPHI|nr:ABC transporter permease [Mucilaginibacter ginsenosidivorax]QEC79837.1 FtsX-like permease family protein [Mucilaginibacter ginsenosidivorax]